MGMPIVMSATPTAVCTSPPSADTGVQGFFAVVAPPTNGVSDRGDDAEAPYDAEAPVDADRPYGEEAPYDA